jgi:hypothetical protein
LPIQKPGAPDTLLGMRSAPLGMRVRRRRASFGGALARREGFQGGLKKILKSPNPERGAPGTRPWAWWMLEDHPPIDDDESEDEYLTRTKQWLPGERALFEVANLKPDDAA